MPETATAITTLSARATSSRYEVRRNALVLLDRLAPQDPQVEHYCATGSPTTMTTMCSGLTLRERPYPSTTMGLMSYLN
ncbi:MAG: hypothetical protein ACRDTJ_26130 [Pseudonocardiaceae bacterium]